MLVLHLTKFKDKAIYELIFKIRIQLDNLSLYNLFRIYTLI
jgi:hypothetical protein